nr:anti-sigma factor [Saprospiraceae bacterium]
MEIKEYIESGVLERYVLGNVSQQEQAEVQCMARVYPEIKEEIASLENVLIGYAEVHATPPPTGLKQKIWGEINAIPSEEKIVPESDSGTRIITLYKAAAAIGLILLIASVGYIFQLHQSFGSLNSEMAEMEENLNQLESTNESLVEVLHSREFALDIINNPDFFPIRLSGLEEKSPESFANVFWNQESQEILLSVGQLPSPPADKQYQLWAIEDGTPVDAGVFNPEEEFTFRKLASVRNPAAFAVTLEPFGGLPQPTLEELYLIGNL